MTGRYNIRYGFASGVLKPAKPYGLPINETILPQYLNDLGFESHMVSDLPYRMWECQRLTRAASPLFA